MPPVSLGSGSQLALVRLRGRMRRALRLFRQITGLTAVASIAAAFSEAGNQSALAPPVHPQCASRIREARITPCGDQWLLHVRSGRRSPRAQSHTCPIGMRCSCVPIRFGRRLVGVAKLVAAPSMPDAAFTSARRTLELVVAETCWDLTASMLSDEVRALRRRVTSFRHIERRGDSDARLAGPSIKPSDGHGSDEPGPSLVNRALSHLQRHYQKPALSLHKVATALGCNPRYLTTVFTATVGEHMHTHLLALRVEHACRLLIGTDLRVKEIAYASGFSTAGRLASTLRSRVGVSPTEYRRIFSSP